MSFAKPDDFKDREYSPKGAPRIAWGERPTLLGRTVHPDNSFPPLHRQANEQNEMVWEGGVRIIVSLNQVLLIS